MVNSALSEMEASLGGIADRPDAAATAAQERYVDSALLTASYSTLSQKSLVGTPRYTLNRFEKATTSSPQRRWPASIARLSRVNTSTTVRVRNRPVHMTAPPLWGGDILSTLHYYVEIFSWRRYV